MMKSQFPQGTGGAAEAWSILESTQNPDPSESSDETCTKAVMRTLHFDVYYECCVGNRFLPLRKVMRLINYCLISKGTWPGLLKVLCTKPQKYTVVVAYLQLRVLMCSKVGPEQPLLAGWLQSCKCPPWLCLFCTCLGPAVTQELSRAILKKFQGIIFLTLQLRLLQSKCLNEYLISVIWWKVRKYYIIYWIKYFTYSGMLEILNFCVDQKKKEFPSFTLWVF